MCARSSLVPVCADLGITLEAAPTPTPNTYHPPSAVARTKHAGCAGIRPAGARRTRARPGRAEPRARAQVLDRAAPPRVVAAQGVYYPPPPPPPRTNWTRLVLLPVLTGHVAAQGVYYPPARPHAHRRASSRRAGPRARHRAAASLPPPSPPQGFVCLPRSTRQERLLENLRTNRTLSASTPHLVSLSRPICTLAPTVRTGALEVRLSADDMAALDSLGTGT